MVNAEDFSAAHLGMTSLGAGPSAPLFWRDKGWSLEVRSLPPGTKVSIEGLDDLKPLLGEVEFKALPTPEGAYFDPLSESRLLSDHYNLGRLVWQTGLVSNSSVILELRQLLERYGPLDTRPRHGREDTVKAGHGREDTVKAGHGREDTVKAGHGREDTVKAGPSLLLIRSMALIIDCLESLRSDDTEFRGAVALRMADYENDIRIFNEGRLAIMQNGSEATKKRISILKHSVNFWLEYVAGGMADPTIFESIMRDRVRSGVNEHLELFGVHPEIRFDDEGSDWVRGYHAPSLGGVLWSQIASMAIGGSRLKRCGNERCKKQPIFEVSATSNRLYCSNTCRFAKLKRNQRLAKAKGKGTNRPGGTR